MRAITTTILLAILAVGITYSFYTTLPRPLRPGDAVFAPLSRDGTTVRETATVTAGDDQSLTVTLQDGTTRQYDRSFAEQYMRK